MLELKNVSFNYGDFPAVRDVSYSLHDHEITALIGPNGSGKSTLFKLLTRTLKPQKGQILLAGQNIWSYAPKTYAQKVAIVHQQNQIYDRILVKDLIKMGRIPYNGIFSKKELLPTILQELELTDLIDKDMHQLSGGQKQRVWLAVALMQEPDYLFLDEPTTYLDLHFQYSFLKLLRRLNKAKNLTICMILHDLNQALEFSGQAVLFNRGEIMAKGKSATVIVPDFVDPVFDIHSRLVETSTGTFLKQY